MCDLIIGPSAVWRSRTNPSLFNQLLKIVLIVVYLINFVVVAYTQLLIYLPAKNVHIGTKVLMLLFGVTLSVNIFWFAIVKEDLTAIALTIAFITLVSLMNVNSNPVLKYSRSAFQMIINFILFVFAIDVIRAINRSTSPTNVFQVMDQSQSLEILV